MRSRLILFGLLLAFAGAFARRAATSAQSPAPTASSTSESTGRRENTRSAFMTSRAKTVDKPPKSTGAAANSPQPRSADAEIATTGTRWHYDEGQFLHYRC